MLSSAAPPMSSPPAGRSTPCPAASGSLCGPAWGIYVTAPETTRIQFEKKMHPHSNYNQIAIRSVKKVALQYRYQTKLVLTIIHLQDVVKTVNAYDIFKQSCF